MTDELVYASYISGVIQATISDTASGRRLWKPDACKLSTHLCGVVRDRTRKQKDRHLKYPHDSIDTKGIGRAAQGQDAEFNGIVETVFTELNQLAEEKKDEEVGLLLLAYRDGVVSRPEIPDATGLTLKQADNARKRLTRLLGHLDPDLQRDAAETIGVRS